ncbi:Imm40 family immunity protein [Pseudomonas sp. NPDC088368]|jgi:hypothetical protein|uniref:Imm40 family immunity protein n=1 Tax=Pseudomonas sp. NPDC088368 TaxID=3364453 RepID=UPI00381815A6
MSFIWSLQIDSILSCGVYLGRLGIKNWALERNDAIRIIDEFEALGIPVLGGDVYQLVGEIAEQTYDSWYCDQQTGELDAVFFARSLDRARKYIHDCSVSGALFVFVPKPS